MGMYHGENYHTVADPGEGPGGPRPPPPPTTHTHTQKKNSLGLCSVDPACIGCSDMRKKATKKITPAWSRSGYAIVHHCEYN